MKVPTILLFLFFIKFNVAFSQEIAIGGFTENPLLAFLIDQNQLFAQNDELQLQTGQWTNIDRKNYLPRFEKAMNYIVLNNRTDLLSNLTEISAYYNYLNNQPIVINSGIKWQEAATNITSKLEYVDFMIGAGLLRDANILLNKSHAEHEEISKIVNQGVSESGLQFVNGTASKRIVADITRNFYNPLIKSNEAIDDPFLFDANTLYREQFIILQQPFYDNFNDFDKRFIVGYIAKWYSTINWNDSAETAIDWVNTLELDFPNYNLMLAKDRLCVGLRIMGYSNEKIHAYIEKIK